MSVLRVLVDPPGGGAWNMAVDEALLESAAERGVATLRFYQWNEPTLSLGYFQHASEREQHSASRNCPLVRRASGGGAIVHDRELTYSIALPMHDVRNHAANDLYGDCHETLVGALAVFEVKATMFQTPAGTCAASEKSQPQPFLCFLRRTCGDIMSGEHKIVGSAQRRRRGGVLQHGSILLDASPCAPELPGIAQLSARHLTPEELASAWGPELAQQLGLQPAQQGMTQHEHLAATQLLHLRFAHADFTGRR
jgi:lipoate-protein ligase A